MKAIIAILLIVAPALSIAQTNRFTISSNKSYPEVRYSMDSTVSIIYEGQVVAVKKVDEDYVIVDSTKTLMALLEISKHQMEYSARLGRKYFAATDILKYIRPDGFVTDWEKFNEAIRHFKKVQKEY